MPHAREILAGVVLSAALAAAPVATACGTDSDCAAEGGSYRIAVPADAARGAEVGAIVYLHGYQASGAQAMGFAALRDMADRLGVALIAPNGEGGTWGLPRVFASRRDDVAFVTGAIEDAVARFPIDADRILLTGFSLGGSMAW